MQDIREIDTETELGKYLLMAISKITSESQTDKTPNEVLAQLSELKEKVFTDAETYGSKGSDKHIVDTNEMVKDINYWKQNCEEEIMTTPISVLRYISELEKLVSTSSQTEISDEEIRNESMARFRPVSY